MPVEKIFFWSSLLILLYTYAGYPLLLLFIIKIKIIINKEPVPFMEDQFLPVTLIVAAYNEEKIIEEKIRNCLELDYPRELLGLVFITDGSYDNTPSIISSYPGIRLLHEQGRKGKLAAINRAMEQVDTPITVFSDANTLLNKDCLRKIIPHFHNRRVGGVAGEKKITPIGQNDAVARGEGLYWKYESLLKRLDASLYTTVGAAGELFSIRTSLYSALPDDTIIEDFIQSLLLCVKGYIVKYEPAAFAEEKASASVKEEMERKIRISAGAFQALGRVKPLFNMLKFPVVSFQFISHRVLRWTLCPLSLLILFITSFTIYFQTGSFLYGVIAVLQVILYVAAWAGWYFARKNIRVKLLYPPFYFFFMNFCIFAGLARFLQKKQSVLWEKAER